MWDSDILTVTIQHTKHLFYSYQQTINTNIQILIYIIINNQSTLTYKTLLYIAKHVTDQEHESET